MGLPISCDDLVLTWAAHSGAFTKRSPDGSTMVPMFDVANTEGYADIERVDCQPGSKDATVVFHSGHGFANWKSLFSATEIMPSHVAAKAAGIRNIVEAFQAADTTAIGKVGDFWNHGWALKPGKIDLSLFPSSGPYRIDSYTDDGLVLVANENWWGTKPATPRIKIVPRTAKVKDRVHSGEVEVVDIGAGSIDGLSVKGFTGGNMPSRSVEQLVLQTNGALARPEVRRALAQCTPRKALFDNVGHPGYTAPSEGLGAGVREFTPRSTGLPYLRSHCGYRGWQIRRWRRERGKGHLDCRTR